MYNGCFSHFCKVSKIHFLRKILECTPRWEQTLRHLAPEGCYLVRSERLPPRHTRNDLCWCSNGLLKHREKIKSVLLRCWRITVYILQPGQGVHMRRPANKLSSENCGSRGSRVASNSYWNGYTIVNWVERLWNPSDSFVICFCGPESAQRSKEFLSFWLYRPIKTLH